MGDDKFTIFTSQREEFTMNAIRSIKFHFKMLGALNALDPGLINILIGGYGIKIGH
jgi:UV DNA damage endonuclease